ncbi:MAG: peptide chain release factor N(5)-glutamine methyltransferase [Gemmatimonadaceae bacterium]|nr:peptide chain release factor N(5)-glutamine methyltransferase [Gemmatimonadaceae bacterium]
MSEPQTLRALQHAMAAQFDALPVAQRPDDPILEAGQALAALLGTSLAALRAPLRDGALAPASLVARAHAVVADVQRGMPMAYAVGVAPFRHLELAVDPRVLIPRPETEIVVEHALRVCADRAGGVAVDIGTGSGAIALSLAQEGRFDAVIATDISVDALTVAQANAARSADVLRCPVTFRHGSDLAPLVGERVRLIVSNPPYIAHAEADALPSAVRDWEPVTALFAAHDGMARYAAIVSAAPAVLEDGGWLVFECDARRAHQVAALFDAAEGWRDVLVFPDLTGRDRVCVGRYAAESAARSSGASAR